MTTTTKTHLQKCAIRSDILENEQEIQFRDKVKIEKKRIKATVHVGKTQCRVYKDKISARINRSGKI